MMFERFFQPNPEDRTPHEKESHETVPVPFTVRRLRFEAGHTLPAPMFIRLKDDPPQDRS